MDVQVILFATAILVYLPLAGLLLYVWNKHGKGERKVQIARIIFLCGSMSIFGIMLFL